jgi:hypothetical protein
MATRAYDAKERIDWIKDTVIFFVTVLTFWILIFQISLVIYQMFLSAAVQERTSVETLLSAGKLSLAVRGLGIAQRQVVPANPPEIVPSLAWLLINRQAIFRARLHDEVQASLKEYSDDYSAGRKPRLWLSYADFNEADLHRTELVGAILTGAQMRRADLREINFSRAKLGCIDLRQADLTNADLIGSLLYLADLSHAHLQGANFSKAYLESADLSGADLSGAILDETNLYGANLANASLTGAISWRNISDIRNANVSNVQDSSGEFVGWAKERGAVEIDSKEWQEQRKKLISCNLNAPPGSESVRK